MFRQRSSYRPHYRTHHSSLEQKTASQVDVWQKIRNHLLLPESTTSLTNFKKCIPWSQNGLFQTVFNRVRKHES